mmetsp:Transcript_19427/g.27920  ORF Transcript_19427/g.27920 Transcript_19427/m.27920 type:complete len:498 (+) Transcript_19427:40-1533(+)
MLYHFTILSILQVISLASAGDIGVIGSVTKQTVISKLDSGSELVSLDTQPAYEEPIYVLSLHGSTSRSQGYDAGLLFGKQFAENYNNLLSGLFGDYPKLEPTLVSLTEAFLDWQWSDYLCKQVPQEYMDELDGLRAGGEEVGVSDLDKMTSRGITLANLPGDGSDIIFVLLDEFKSSRGASLNIEQLRLLPEVGKIIAAYNGHQCSMFGAWGSRTVNGDLYSARNLDWLPDLGVNQYKLLTVHHPPGGVAHVTVGFAGIWGALAGMAATGLTVHEANLESKQDTFRGFPWILRLRHVMAYSPTGSIEEALDIWGATNNTVGFNHMVGSATDGKAVCMETMKDYTAYFEDMDPREDGAVDPSTGEVYGHTLSDAVYRTNHGYDPTTQENYQWYGYHAYQNSKDRYDVIYQSFKDYEDTGVLVGASEAVRITSAVGIKGDETNEDNCDPTLYHEGINVLSVTYDPARLTLYAAFEDGTGEGWVPAACNGYIEIDMSQWF